MRQVRQIMGMPISIDAPHAGPEACEAAFAVLTAIDLQFSPFRPASELCRFQRGEVQPADCSAEFQAIQAACQHFEQLTEGYFSPFFAGSGKYDPTGYVKGWAIQQAGQALEAQGVQTYMINAGGDILARSAGERQWRIALQHPRDRKAAIGSLTAGTIAVATSGTYARGTHILDPHTGKPVRTWLSVTVTGPDIVTADVFATAICAMGRKGLDFIDSQPGYEALCIDDNLGAAASKQFGASTQNVPSR